MTDGEIEYESDPEEAKLSLKLRRRVASDDEEESDEGWNRQGKPLRRVDGSDVESEGGGEGGHEEYSEEELAEYEESGGERHVDDLEVLAVERGREESVGAVAEELMKERREVDYDAGEIDTENGNVEDGLPEEERKEIKPFAVPTAGAFYMHDDRFRDNAGCVLRRTLRGRKLWESKDNRKWGHDKFEELNMQERHHEEHRMGSKGRGRGPARGYLQQNRPREYVDDSSTQHYKNSNNKQSNTSKSVRG